MIDIVRNFTYHRPTDQTASKFAAIRLKGKEFAFLLEEHCPESRELSLAMTNLEQVMFWANAAIARNNQ